MRKEEYDKSLTADFFNQRASGWDNYLKEIDHIVAEKIVVRSSLGDDLKILDVGCGTGVFTNAILKIGQKLVTGIDLSAKMIEIYSKKFPSAEGICGDFDQYNFGATKFDTIVVYNAFPHFEDYDLVFRNSKKILRSNGKLIIAHSMTREELNDMHRRAGKVVENDILISDKQFDQLYKSNGFAKVLIENDQYFYAMGFLK